MSAADGRRFRPASNDVVREINRRLLLNLVRTEQPLSRADLSRLSGLQRSTVSLIVEQLLRERWILEGAAARLPRGRHPTSLRMNDARAILGVDIRPIQTTMAVADVNGRFATPLVMETPRDPRTAVRAILRWARPLVARYGRNVDGIGITLPGRYDARVDRIIFAPNLHWTRAALREPLARATGVDVVLDNAANACVQAAVWFDRVEPSRHLVVVTVSEGIGAGVLMNGQIVRGATGMAGEFGHVPLDSAGPPCTCGSRGCWEVYGSNRAALRYFAEQHGSPAKITFLELLTLADRGDVAAGRALETMARQLGRGLRMIVAGLAPERILIIGDLTRSWQRFAPIIEEEVRAQALPGGVVPRLEPVHEDGLARLRGAAALVLQKHLGAIPGGPIGQH